MAFCVLFAGHGYADNHTNRNPATIGFVENVIEVAGIRNAYSAGTAISIFNWVISGAYTGGEGIRVNGSVISVQRVADAGTNYWSSTSVYSGNSNAYYIAINMDVGSSTGQNNDYYVRAFRQF